ncbi:hypothetical protein DV735_g4871, partial [Chaetothyriales sp. CBS 134920]
MAMATLPHISSRASANLKSYSKLGEVRSHCFTRQYDPDTNPDGIVALAIAENRLMRDEITAYINNQLRITPWHLTYGHGSQGSNPLREAVSRFVNEHFKPHTPVLSSHICICNGAGSAVDDLCFVLGDPGDGLLIGRPLYTGFFPDVEARAKLKMVLVSFGDIDPLSPAAISCYEAHLSSPSDETPIRAILIANPHNPLGRPYPREFLEAMLRLCNKYNVHLISDEVYVKSFFPSTDFPEGEEFTSVLSLDIASLCNPGLVHVIYGMSKDFCANGIRVGCLVTPFNRDVYKAFKSVSSFTRASQLAEQIWMQLLTDTEFQKTYFPDLARRMTDAYEYVTGLLRQRGIFYSPASTTCFLWIDLRPYLSEDSYEAEVELNWRMARAGVWIAAGGSFGGEKHGWYRITFATPRHELALGMERLFKVLDEAAEAKAG